jgi:hypothetical protein
VKSKREYLKDKISELAMNSNSKKIRYLYKGITRVIVLVPAGY